MELCPKYGISLNTFDRWKSKSAAMSPTEVRRLKELEDENSQLQRMVADLSRDN